MAIIFITFVNNRLKVKQFVTKNLSFFELIFLDAKFCIVIYEHSAPSEALSRYIKSYWLIDSEADTTLVREKIIPDGYPELIFHYGDPYRVNINGSWETQGRHLIAGQIKNHFYLENTGKSGMIGVKLMPTAPSTLFGLNMSKLTDFVGPISILPPGFTRSLMQARFSLEHKEHFIKSFENLISDQLNKVSTTLETTEMVVSEILKSKGNVSISAICEQIEIGQRQLERQFSRVVGLTPKFYARIIRFAHIFELMKSGDSTWSDLVYASGFFDQSHFIKNFKEFTGEDPSAYGFDVKNMANFHMKQ